MVSIASIVSTVGVLHRLFEQNIFRNCVKMEGNERERALLGNECRKLVNPPRIDIQWHASYIHVL